MCTEYFKKANKYWHFKTTNPDFIKVSNEGVQDNVLKVRQVVYFILNYLNFFF